MNAPSTDFMEVAAERRTVEVPLSHYSIEVGHLYADDFRLGDDSLRDQFRRVEPWAAVLKQVLHRAEEPQTKAPKPRVSTCYMVDDYFTPFDSPKLVIPALLEAAADANLQIDYVARESGCARAGDLALAELVRRLLVAEPPPETNGSRPPVGEVAWLCNGQRSPAMSPATEALRPVQQWQPPMENSARNHSIFVDIELWDEHGQQKPRWSCSFLAAVWQLLRLGLLRDQGNAVATPVLWSQDDYPDSWAELPPVIKVNQHANPFSAYQTFTVLEPQFLPIENAVRTILAQVNIDSAVNDQVIERSRKEGMPLSREFLDRIAYVFLTGSGW